MSDVFRIKERFNITGRGTVYIVEKNKKAVIKLDDIYKDLRGNSFRVKGIEMFRRLIVEGVNFDELPIGILLEPLDHTDVMGNILVRDLNEINFLFCNHPLYKNRVDEDYQEEYQEAGLEYACALFSYEDLERDKLSLYGEQISGLTVYRGWMMKQEMYRKFYSMLEERGIILINSPEEYERYHILPGWYEDFKDSTAETVWETTGELDSALNLAGNLEGAYIVKDYVKSRKHEWYDACFIKNISATEDTKKVIGNFINRQGDSLVGGVVLRKYENLKQIGFHERSGMPLSEEYRVFIYAGRVMIIDDYWCEGKDVKLSKDEKKWIENLATRIKSNFVTMDIARKVDGTLIVMELGDGQVSGIQQINPEHFYFSFQQGRTIAVEDLFLEGTLILAGDPMPDVSIEDMRTIVAAISTTQELVDAYVRVHNKFWFIEDDIYDFEEGTSEYDMTYQNVCDWKELMEDLDARIMKTAADEGLLAERKPDSGSIKQLEKFMEKYGYRNGSGWWVKCD